MPKEEGEQIQETENEEELEDEKEDEFEAHDNESPSSSSGQQINWLYEPRVYYYYSCSEISLK
jgi:hypothetical protein